MMELPSLRGIFSLKSHLEAHTDRKSIVNSIQIFVQPNNELACPKEKNGKSILDTRDDQLTMPPRFTENVVNDQTLACNTQQRGFVF